MKTRHLIGLFILLLLLCVGALFFMAKSTASPVAEIYQNGKLVRTVDLSQTEEIVLSNGEKENVLQVENGSISMISASCPDKLCVKTGPIQNSLYPIVCLPNRVTVTVKSAQSVEADAISQ